MALRVAHLSQWWKGGAVAMRRIHQGLLDQGVESRVHCVEPVDGSFPHGYSLPKIKPPRWRKWQRKLIGEYDPHLKRIQSASDENDAYEVFSPPWAISPHRVDEVLDKIDVLHLHWCGGYFDFPEFFSHVRVPVVWTLHDQNPYFGGFHYQGDVDRATSMLPIEMECRRVKRDALAELSLSTAANSDWNLQQSRKTDVLPATARHGRIYLPLPIEQYLPIAKHKAKRHHGLDESKLVVGFASGDLGNRRKGFEDLIKAFSYLPEDVRQRTTLLSFGREPEEAIRKQVPVQWNHLGHVRPGIHQSLAYSAMDLFVCPSHEEAFGQTPLEALACQTPVVGTQTGGIPETVLEGQTGILAAPGRPDSLADAMLRLIEDPNARCEYGKAGRWLTHERHGTKTITRQYLELYDRLLQEGASVDVRAGATNVSASLNQPRAA